MSETQSAASHAKVVPMYHYVTTPLLLIPAVYFIVQAVRAFSTSALMMALLRARITDLPTEVLIGLRFASDEELAELTRRVLDGELADRKSVKGAIRRWRADHQRI